MQPLKNWAMFNIALAVLFTTCGMWVGVALLAKAFFS